MAYEWSETASAKSRRSSAQTTRLAQEQIAAAMERSARALFAQQAADGFWCGELTADTTLESDYILLQLWLHQPGETGWNPPTRGRIDRAAASILARQLPDGGFNTFSGGPADVSATVKAYCALKLAGMSPDCDPLRRARQRIRESGGQRMEESNSARVGSCPPSLLRPRGSGRPPCIHPAGDRRTHTRRDCRPW